MQILIEHASMLFTTSTSKIITKKMGGGTLGSDVTLQLIGVLAMHSGVKVAY